MSVRYHYIISMLVIFSSLYHCIKSYFLLQSAFSIRISKNCFNFFLLQVKGKCLHLKVVA